MPLRHLVPMLAAAVLLSGCGGSDETKTGETADSALPPGHVPITPPESSDLLPLTQALLDSGNAAFRKQDFVGALAFYSKASQAQPGHAAPWFGVHGGLATKNTACRSGAHAEGAPETRHVGPATRTPLSILPPVTGRPEQNPSEHVCGGVRFQRTEARGAARCSEVPFIAPRPPPARQAPAWCPARLSGFRGRSCSRSA
jgi:hypothetical protein